MAVDALSVQKIVSQVLKYVGILGTTALGIYALTIETVDKSKTPYRFTPTGKKYLWMLIGLTVMTSVITAWDDHVDKQIKEVAEEHGNEIFTKKLTDAMIIGLKPKLEEQQRQMQDSVKGLEIGIGNATNKLNVSVLKSSRNLESNLHETADSLKSSQDLLAAVTIQVGVHTEKESPEMREDEVEKRLAKWSELHNSGECLDPIECQMYTTMYDNHLAGRYFVEHIWRNGLTRISWHLEFRGFNAEITLEECVIEPPFVAAHTKLDYQWEGTLNYPCLQLAFSSNGVETSRHWALKVENSFFDKKTRYPRFKFEPVLDYKAKVVDTELQSFSAWVCSNDAKFSQHYADTILSEPFDIVIGRTRIESIAGSASTSFARPGRPARTKENNNCVRVPYYLSSRKGED